MKIQELTEKIYQDGIEKARQEERVLLEGARKEAAELVESAKKEADSIVSGARSEASRVKEKLDAEIKIAAGQALSLLKQQIADLLVESVLAPSVREAVGDRAFIESLIQSVVAKWGASQARVDLLLVLPESQKAQLEEFFASRASGLLAKGLTVRFEARMQGGFAIGPSDGSFKLSFTEKDFVQFFKSFLRQKTKELLFPGTTA